MWGAECAVHSLTPTISSNRNDILRMSQTGGSSRCSHSGPTSQCTYVRRIRLTRGEAISGAGAPRAALDPLSDPSIDPDLDPDPGSFLQLAEPAGIQGRMLAEAAGGPPLREVAGDESEGDRG